MRIPIVALATFLLLASCRDHERMARLSIDRDLDACLASTQSNPEWAECSAKHLEVLQTRLKAAYSRAEGSLTEPEGRANLKHEQELWQNFLDQSCKYYSVGEFGQEGQVLHAPGCRSAILEDRIEDLESLAELSDPGGP